MIEDRSRKKTELENGLFSDLKCTVFLQEYALLLYNFVKKCPNNSRKEYKYTAIFGQLVICILPV